MQMNWKFTKKITPQVINELTYIAQHGGLTPENIVDRAKDSTNVLHSLFEWDDSIAAKNWRLQQSRMLINEVKIVIEEREYYAFENVSVAVSSIDGTQEASVSREYKPIIEILSNQVLRQQVIRQALMNLSYWEHQNEKYTELAPIIASARETRERLERQWQTDKQNKKNESQSSH